MVLSDSSAQVDFAITAANEIAIDIDRTVGPTPLNGVVGGSLRVELWLSWDGGTTFRFQGAIEVASGQMLDTLDNLLTSSGLSLQNFDPNPTHARVVLSAIGTMTVAGTVKTT